jgi:hypothetical protein
MLVHGEPEALKSLKEGMAREKQIEEKIPEYGERIQL